MGSNHEGVVFIVDDDASMREALGSLLDLAGIRSRCFTSAQDFLRHPQSTGPACLLLDVRLPGASGLDLQRELAAQHRPLPIVFMSAFGDIPTAVGAMKAGALEFLPKPFTEHQLLDAIGRALEQDRAACGRRAQLKALQRRYGHLTPREKEVMAKLVRGGLNKQVAAELGISEVTVKVHKRHIMEKMQAVNFAELIRMAEGLR